MGPISMVNYEKNNIHTGIHIHNHIHNHDRSNATITNLKKHEKT